MKLLLFFSLCIWSYTHIEAQNFYHNEFKWEENPGLHQLDDTEANESAVILLDSRSLEFAYEPVSDELLCLHTEHRIIRVSDDKAVEAYNKFFIPMYGTIEVKDLRARTISPQGVVMELGSDQIKELDNLENAGAYRIFAVEGLVPGSEVEYYYSLLQAPRYFDRDVLQSDVRTRKSKFELISPTNLIFEVKTYNGLAEAVDSIHEFRKFIIVNAENLPALHSEKYAYPQPHLQRIEYKLAFNLFADSGRLLSWSAAADRYQQLIYNADKKEKKAVKKLMADLHTSKMKSDAEIVAALERYYKDNIRLEEGRGDEYESADRILENRFSNDFGFLRLFATSLVEAGIEHEVVMTTDRTRYKFDGDFDSWNYLEEVFFYIPGINKYLAPARFEYRDGLIPFEWRDNAALFFKPNINSPSQSPVSEVRYIEQVSVKDHYDDIFIDVDFSSDMQSVNLSLTRKMGGYRASVIQPYYDLLPPENQTEIVSQILKASGPDAVITDSEVLNSTWDDWYGGLPFTVEGSLTSSSLLEKAGPKVLLKLGEIIGPQVAMYQDRERELPVDMDYPHTYTRELRIHKPEGYIIKGIEDVEMDIQFDDEKGLPAMGFVSTYKEQGSDFIIIIEEYYNKTEYPKSSYEHFRQVINAAADFNKKILVLEKSNP